MKNGLKSFLQFIIIFNITIAPIPFLERVQIVHAADDSCEDESNTQGEPGVYRPGCEFNEALAKASDEQATSGAVGTIEQFIAAAFGLAAVNSLVFNVDPEAKKDCPDYITPYVTLRAMQVGSLVYILGNIQANTAYKKAAKEAVDIQLTSEVKRAENEGDGEQASENREFNQKQLDAYEALIGVYEKKVSALKKKQTMAMVAEAAYLTAFGVEVSLTQVYAGRCTAAKVAAKTASAARDASIQAIAAAAAASSAALPACVEAIAAAQTAAAVHNKNKVTNATLSSAFTDAQGRLQSEETVCNNRGWENFGGDLLISYLSTCGTLGERRDAAAAQEATRSHHARTEIKASMRASERAIAARKISCQPIAVPASVLSAQVAQSSATPVMCCGSRTLGAPADGDTPTAPAPGKINITKDVIIPPLMGMNIEPASLEFTKNVVYNFLHQYGTDQIESRNLGNLKKALLYKKLYSQLNKFDQNFFQILNSRELKSELTKYKDIKGHQSLDHFLMEIKDRVQSQISMDAHAGTFSDLLGLGTKMMALQHFMGKFMRNTALTTPQNRMFTYGAMAAVNGALIYFNKGAGDKAKERLEIVKEEAKKFADSHALQTSRDTNPSGNGNSAGDTGYEDPSDLEIFSGDQVVACADAKGNTFVPATCPSKLRRGSTNIKVPSATARRLNGTPLGNSLPLISDIAYQTGSGNGFTDAKNLSGKLGNLSGTQKALRRQVDKLAQDYDKNILGKQKDSMGLNIEPLTKSNANFRKIFSGSASGNGLNQAQLAALGGQPSSSAKDLKPGEKINPPEFKYHAPNSAGYSNNDFSYGNDNTMAGQGGGSESLDNFEINTEEITQRKDVSIFKLISNRYLRTYPVLVGRRKK